MWCLTKKINGIGLSRSSELKTENQKMHHSHRIIITRERIALLSHLYQWEMPPLKISGNLKLAYTRLWSGFQFCTAFLISSGESFSSRARSASAGSSASGAKRSANNWPSVNCSSIGSKRLPVVAK